MFIHRYACSISIAYTWAINGAHIAPKWPKPEHNDKPKPLTVVGQTYVKEAETVAVQSYHTEKNKLPQEYTAPLLGRGQKQIHGCRRGKQLAQFCE